MNELITKIDNLLPQTQCGLCGYAGCKPYATAIVEQQERVDRCPPGGVATMEALAEITATDPSPLRASMQARSKPNLTAKIIEESCIGCTKCIQACPVDAIMGSAKHMHSIIQSECTGCELCIAPCPMDCIELVPQLELNSASKKTKAVLAKTRFENREQRLQNNKKTVKPVSKITERKNFVAEALARVKAKQESNHSLRSRERPYLG